MKENTNYNHKKAIQNFDLKKIEAIEIPHQCGFCTQVNFIVEYVQYPHMKEPLKLGHQYTIVFN